MKFAYFIILCLVVFQGILVVTAPIFNTGLEGIAGDYSGYALTNSTSVLDILFSERATGAWGSFAVIAIIGVIGAIVVKNYVVAAVALFLGLVTGLYIGAVDIMFRISDNVYIHGIITVVGVAVGLLVLYSVVEMFTGQGGDT
jgi:hypothetical protein